MLWQSEITFAYKRGEYMKVDTNNVITITEANQNFSKATRIADKSGAAVIFKRNKPVYKLVNLEKEPDMELTDDEKIDLVARRILMRYKDAFMELAK